ncbi:MAG: CdaR family protein [Armatimonadota bacterium]
MKQNVTLFLVALFFSLMLWLQVGSFFEPQTTKQLTFKLEEQGLPHDFVAVFPQTLIEVNARGTTSAFQRFHESDVRATVDLSDVKGPGTKDAKVNIIWPTDTGVTLTPTQRVVRFYIENEVEADRPVIVFPQGEAPKGVQFDLTNAKVFPQKVKIKGPSSLLLQVNKVRARLNLASLPASPSTGDTVPAPIEIVGSDNEPIQGLRAEPPEVTIDPRAVAAATVRTVLVNPTFDGQPSPGYEISNVRVVPNQVELHGTAPGTLEGIVRVLTEQIKLAGLASQTRQRVKLRLPLGVTCDPEEVGVTVDIVISPKGARQ